MADWTGLIDKIEEKILAAWPDAHANGIWWDVDEAKLKELASQVPFALCRIDLEPRPGGEERGTVELFYVRQFNNDVAALIVKLQALQSALDRHKWAAGQVEGTPKIGFGLAVDLNREFREGGLPFRAGVVRAVVSI